MDPNQTLRDLLDALEFEDETDALELACYLLGWLEAGGFLPELSDKRLPSRVTDRSTLRRWLADVRYVQGETPY